MKTKLWTIVFTWALLPSSLVGLLRLRYILAGRLNKKAQYAAGNLKAAHCAFLYIIFSFVFGFIPTGQCRYVRLFYPAEPEESDR